MLVLPVMGMALLLGETFELILTDARLRARHAFSVALRQQAAEFDLNRTL
jgi:hypothetical protein